RDRFILSAGHGSLLLYALLHLTGYADMTMAELKSFRQLGSRCAGHPERGHADGIEVTTGPLGQGVGNSVGMAVAERVLAARFGKDLVDHYTYVMVGDGCLMEGISQEAISLAGHLRQSKLIVLWDDNGISIDGGTSLATSENQLARFSSAGWDATAVDGHDTEALAAAISEARTSVRPSLIACKTTIAFGAPTKAGSAAAHGSPLGAAEIAGSRQRLGWVEPPFVLPEDVVQFWREAGSRGAKLSSAWKKRLETADAKTRAEFARRMKGELAPEARAALAQVKAKAASEAPRLATRQASGNVLDALAPAMPELIGGSADLTGSNNTKAKSQKIITAKDFSGGYIHYGVREHGMAAAMNGLAAHGGIIPYGGSFLVFTDYCRPSIRLSALMGLRVIYVMTHDSIGLGEDGPTHQPVEHLAALRAIPNLLVFRPCDAVETVECWQLALQARTSPSALALTRQNLPQLRTGFAAENRCAAGAYELLPADAGAAQVSLFASGSEVAIAAEARKLLAARGVAARVVSVPCFELFLGAPVAQQRAVVGTAPVRIGIEAAIRQGWDAVIGSDGLFVGMSGFGASGPYKDLYRHFGITPERVADAAFTK